ncbi:hypothetical protein [Mucilaginibacter psychrotolerans]|nr:hypothetical protein [Mucilaginibacter psychrotolerans]
MKSKPLTKTDVKFLKELRQSVKEVNLFKVGKLNGKPLDTLLKQL